MNTKIAYLYRDASNYHIRNEAVIDGQLTDEQIDIILSCLDDKEYFIPSQVGLDEQRFEHWDEQDDHPFMELHRSDFENTSECSTVDLTPDELVENFLSRKNNWDVEQWMVENNHFIPDFV